MDLNPKKWLPETRLEMGNYGDSAIQVKCGVKPDEKTFGKSIIIHPRSKQYVLIKDFLPENIKDYDLLKPENITITMKNIGNSTTQYTILEEGPFKHKTQIHPESDIMDVLTLYEEYMLSSDNYSMKAVLQQPVSEFYKQNSSDYCNICLYRAKMYGHLFKIEEANAWFEEGWQSLGEKNKWKYCFEWAKVLQKVFADKALSPTLRNKLIQKNFTLLSDICELTKALQYKDYHVIAVNCLRAFLLCCMESNDAALSLFKDTAFEPVSSDKFLDVELNSFFEYLAFGFSVAIELRNENLLRNLCKLVTAGEPDILLEPSPMKCLQRTISYVSSKGRKQTQKMMFHLMDTAYRYKPELPVFNYFVKINLAKDEIELDKFIPYVGD
jgi:hypothetical protein